MERSAGGILFTKGPTGRRYVVVTEKDGHTGLPKGHVEPGETLRQTACREIMEETGLQAEILPLPALEEEYELPRGGTKHVTYFFMRFAGTEPVCDPTQVRAVKLLPLEQALTELTFDGARGILRQADAILAAY